MISFIATVLQFFGGIQMKIEKGTKFRLGEQKVIAIRTMDITLGENGLFLLDMRTPCDEPDIKVLPVDYVENLTKKEKHLVIRDNIVIGETKDICLK